MMTEAFRARASTATRLSMIDPATPDGLSKALAIGASECLSGARRLEEPLSDTTGEYILLFHAVELALKAFLVKAGVQQSRLKKKPFGHDVVALYNEAIKLGLALNEPDIDETLAWNNEWHATTIIRYQVTKEITLPMCTTLFSLANR